MLDKAFEKIEGNMPGKRMYVHSLSEFEERAHGGKTIFVDMYEHHVLLLGENGSIEIRLTQDEKDASEELSHPYANLKVIFEKAGADGHYLWDTPTS